MRKRVCPVIWAKLTCLRCELVCQIPVCRDPRQRVAYRPVLLVELPMLSNELTHRNSPGENRWLSRNFQRVRSTLTISRSRCCGPSFCNGARSRTEPTLTPLAILPNQAFSSGGSGNWKTIDRPDQHPNGYPVLQGEDAAQSYAEFCYFHPFVRNFLYVNRGDIRDYVRDNKILPGKPTAEDLAKISGQAINRNLRILNRKNLNSLVVDYRLDDATIQSTFDIRSCWLYLFDTQIAMLGLRMELKSSQRDNQAVPNNLRMVIQLQDILRRAYAPYTPIYPADPKSTFIGRGAGHCAERVALYEEGNDEPIATSTFGRFEINVAEGEVETARKAMEEDRFGDIGEVSSEEGRNEAEQQQRHVFLDREPYTTPWLREILKPLYPTRLNFEPEKEPPRLHDDENLTYPLRYEQVEDDRIPILSFIAVDQPRAITGPDCIRLACIDDAGDWRRYPYSPDFLGERPLDGVAYDRFWCASGERLGQDKTQQTRWLCTGYGFVGVGSSEDKAFFCDPHSGALAHYRHHYFALAMIAHFHRATLLRLKHALSESADAMLNREGGGTIQDQELAKNDATEAFHKEVELLMKEMLRFRTLYWFPEVSNQIQAQELFAMFRKHLNLESIFREVAGDYDYSAELLRRLDEDAKRRTLAEKEKVERERQTQEDKREKELNAGLATIGLVLAIVGPTIAVLVSGVKKGIPDMHRSPGCVNVVRVYFLLRFNSAMGERNT
jgi:hypothetical protein